MKSKLEKRLRGYIFSRPFMEERVPQHVQNIVIRDYCSKKDIQYFRENQITELIEFSRTFGAEPILAVKFSSKWTFFELFKLRQTPKGDYAISKKDVEELGISFEELISA